MSNGKYKRLNLSFKTSDKRHMELYSLLTSQKGSVTDFLCNMTISSSATQKDVEKAKEEIIEAIRSVTIVDTTEGKHDEEIDLNLFDSFGF